VGSYFAGLQICGVAPRIKIHKSGPSMDRGNKFVRALEKVFQPDEDERLGSKTIII
jgi:hypothetical protein